MKTKEQIFEQIDYWTEWANKSYNQSYDIALFKIWIEFEKFLSDIFILYATGKKSEENYKPDLKIQFESEEQLNALLRDKSKYINYLEKIKSLSKHIFKIDIFAEIIFSDENNSNVYHQVETIRNFVAHESGDAKTKYIRSCLSGGSYIEVNTYLKRRKDGKTKYSYYVMHIKNMIELLINPEPAL